MKNGSDIFAIMGNGLTYVMTTIQTNEIFQIVELCLSILTSLIIIGFKIWKWWKNASADGKITKEEIKELSDDIEEDVDKLKDKNKKGE